MFFPAKVMFFRQTDVFLVAKKGRARSKKTALKVKKSGLKVKKNSPQVKKNDPWVGKFALFAHGTDVLFFANKGTFFLAFA